ncbi:MULTISPECIES: GNAT family N-acetyltransferase [unclassified Microbacterium]|uniref:GNAT family N-acetyltransferase n=1 Tax=unclassified Microbacterium TaxID=2609290 RepID=UPI00386E021A
MTGPVIRRIALHEWREVRDLRLRAVADPAASVAFLTTTADELARPDAFWRERAAGGAMSDEAAQFVAVDGERWIGTATVLLRPEGSDDHLGRAVAAPRADVVGVFVDKGMRGRGILGQLMDAAARWASERGVDALTLDVHADNARAQAAYRRLGFAPTGETYTSSIGPELEMRRVRPGTPA